MEQAVSAMHLTD